jgi:hypothetical protein
MKPMSKITPNDTRWAIAAKVPIETLEGVRAKLPKLLRGKGSKVVVGDDGFTALLVFGENADEGESAATQLSRDARVAVYLLDFDSDAPFIKELAKGRERRKRGHPADFLDGRGIVAPGYAHEPSPLVSVGLVEDLTPKQAHKTLPEVLASAFRAHRRGTLVVGCTGLEIMTLAMRAKRRGFLVDVDRRDGWFACDIVEVTGVKQFAPTRPSVNLAQIDSVLGETTLEGILRVLEIPRDLLPS